MAGQPTLTWGVKQSFRSYVQGSGGTIQPGPGVSLAPDGAFVFAAAPGASLSLDADGRLQGQGAFLGEIQFEAHGGMLSVRIAEPAIEVTGAGCTLTVDDRGRRTSLAVLDLAAAAREGDDLVIPAKMSMEGWQVLGDHYPMNTPIDPVRLALG